MARANPKLFVALDYRLEQTLARCPSEAAFMSMVEGQLGYNPFRSPAPLRIVAIARSREVGLGGSIEWYDAAGSPRGERQLSAEHMDCAALARAMSFAVAVQIQLLAREAEGAAPEAAQTDELAPAANAAAMGSSDRSAALRAPDDTTPESDSRGSARWRLLAGGGPFLALGIAPRVAVGARLFAAGRLDWFALELGAEATLPAQYSAPAGAGFDARVAFGSVAGCVVTTTWSACSVSKVGTVHVRGFGVELAREPTGVLAYTGARFVLSQEFPGRWLGALRLEALASLAPWDVTLNQRTVWSMPVVSLSLGTELAQLFL